MRVLDRYLLRELFFPVFLCSLILVFLVLIADVFDNLDVLLKNRTPLALILRYYLLLIPVSFSQTIPWATLLGTFYLLVSFNFHNEIVAMKVAGLEINSIVRPLLFFGFLIGVFCLFLGDTVVPATFHAASELREIHIEKKKGEDTGRVAENVTYYSEGNQLQYYRFFDYGKRRVEDVILLWLDPQTRNTRRKMVAKKGLWREKRWVFENVTEYEMDPEGQILGEPRNFVTKVYADVRTSPEDLRHAASESQFLSSKELRHYIQKLEENGVRAYHEKVEHQYRIAAPWQSLVMMLIAIPLLSPTRSKKVIAFNVLICLGLVFLFHVTGAITLALGKTGRLLPFFSAWLNTILFSVAAVFYLERANE